MGLLVSALSLLLLGVMTLVLELNKTLVLGVLTVLIVSGVFYVEFLDQARIRIDNDKTSFYVREGTSKVWLVAGREYNSLFDGTTKLYRDVGSIKISSVQDGNKYTITRRTTYKRGPVIVDTYSFDGDIKQIEFFPISHKIEVFNGTGYYYKYEVRQLTYDGDTFKIPPEQVSQKFGKNMKVEWWKDFRLGWVYKSGSMYVKSDKIDSDYAEFDVRLFDPVDSFSFDGLDRNVTAELGSIINVSSTIAGQTVCIDVLDYPGLGVNESCGSTYTSFMLNVSHFVITKFNNSATTINISTNNTLKKANFSIDNRSSFDDVLVDLSCVGGTSPCLNVSVSIGDWNKSYYKDNNSSKSMNVYGDYYYDRFIRLTATGESYDNLSYIFPNAGSKTFYFDTPDHPKNVSFIIRATGADNGNELDFTATFNDTTDDYKNYSNSVSSPNPIGDNFEGSDTFQFWSNFTGVNRVSGDVGYSVGQADDYVYVITSDVQAFNTGSNPREKYAYYTNYDLRNVSIFTSDTEYRIMADTTSSRLFDGSLALYVFDGVSKVAIDSYGKTCSNVKCNYKASYNYTVNRSNPVSDLWEVYRDSTKIGTINTGTLNHNKEWRFMLSSYTNPWNLVSGGSPSYGNATIRSRVLKVGGIGLYAKQSVPGYNLSGNYTTNTLATGATNYVSAILNATAKVPSGTSIKYYLSPDGTNYELVTNGLEHTFSNSGTTLSFRAVLSTTSQNITPILYSFNILVVPKALQNLSIDYGGDGIVDWSSASEVNSSNTPITLSYAMFNYSSGTDIPIVFATNSSGQIRIDTIKINSTLNPVSLNYSAFGVCSECQFNVSTGELPSGQDLIVSNLDVRYVGGNYTLDLLAHQDDYSVNTSRSIIYYYSDWNYSMPPNTDYVEFIPRRPTSKNVTPFGQTSKYAMLNITGDNFGGKDYNFSMYLNESDSCVNLSVGNKNYATNSYCYQENASISTECGSAGGNYGNSSSGNDCILYINYTKPPSVTGANWQIKTYPNGTINNTIPKTCFNENQDSLILKVYIAFPSNVISEWCYNYSQWVQVGTNGAAGGTAYRLSNYYPIIDSNYSTSLKCFYGNWYTTTPSNTGGVYEEGIFWSYDKVKLNSSWKEIKSKVSYGDYFGLWFYADYGCNSTSWRWWQPTMYFRACGDGVDICSEELV